MNSRKFLILVSASIFLLLIGGSISTAMEKERLVLMPLQGTGIDSSYKPVMESAIAEGLSDSFEVLYGRNAEEKIKEIYKKRSEVTAAGEVCGDRKCMQEIGRELKAELVATIRVLKNPQGYFLSLNIINIFDNELVLSEFEPCEGCNEFQIINILKKMVGAKPTSSVVDKPKPQPDEKLGLEEKPEAKVKVKISSKPPGARIYLDGKDTGKATPNVIHIVAGEHELNLDKKTGKGRLTHKSMLKVEPDRRVALFITDFEESLGAMLFMKGGCFKMGDQFGEGWDDEKPAHDVCVDAFFIGEHEVTQGEWKQVMGNNPSKFKKCGVDCPVEQVSYYDVQEYIRRLNNQTGLNYRLPTEAEWECAAREGGRMVKYPMMMYNNISGGRFGTGKDTVGPDEANFDASSEYKKPYSRSGIYREKTVPVKSFPPNSLGLYDMTGNVEEWVQDWYDGGYYKKSPRNNPKGPNNGSSRVMRGGSWLSEPSYVRAANRDMGLPSRRLSYIGFRLALGFSARTD